MDYEIRFRSTKQLTPLNIDAVVNLGWCKTGEEWVRNGDYITTTAHSVSVEKGKQDYDANISVEKYGRPSPVRPLARK